MISVRTTGPQKEREQRMGMITLESEMGHHRNTTNMRAALGGVGSGDDACVELKSYWRPVQEIDKLIIPSKTDITARQQTKTKMNDFLIPLISA